MTGRSRMSCEHLICAHCAGPVAEGRCPTCREARAHVHHHSHGMSVQLIAAALLVLALLTVAAMHLAH
ncbi:MAG TPA: hypothetical protein VMA72_30380 [Streptosporangiaceae bacterium]|nr:hypothetical protein [Streptosporangiaceae bacterium]